MAGKLAGSRLLVIVVDDDLQCAALSNFRSKWKVLPFHLRGRPRTSGR
jgi:hypothetical protein